MKKIFLLFAVMFASLAASAQTWELVKSIDYSTSTWRGWNANDFKTVDGAMVVANAEKRTNNYDVQYHGLDGIEVKAGETYKVCVTIQGDADGEIALALCDWGHNGANGATLPFTTEKKTIEYETTSDFGAGCFLMMQSGFFVGSYSVYKIEVYVAVSANKVDILSFPKNVAAAAHRAKLYDAEAENKEAWKDVAGEFTLVSPAKVSQDWDSQLWFVMNEALAADASVHLAFDAKASSAQSLGTGAHAEPGDWKAGGVFTNPELTTEWKTFDYTINAKSGWKSFALDLTKATEVTYDFKNVVVELLETINMGAASTSIKDGSVVPAALAKAGLTYSFADNNIAAVAGEGAELGLIVKEAYLKDGETVVASETAAKGTASEIKLFAEADVKDATAYTVVIPAYGMQLVDAEGKCYWANQKDMTLAFSTIASAQIADGSYFISNEAASKANEAPIFLSNGAAWGTRSVLADQGIEYNVARLENGKYILKSGIKGDTKALRPSDGFNDQSGEWSIYEAGEGQVYLFNGTQYFGWDGTSMVPTYFAEATDACVWSFVTAADRKAALAEATAENPVDATVFIQAPDFLNADIKNAAWQGAPAVGGNNGAGNTLINNTNAEKWHTGTFEVSQAIEGLPNGIYALSLNGLYRHGNRDVATTADAYQQGTEVFPVVSANEVSAKFPSVYTEAKEAAEGGWAVESKATDGTIYFIPNSQADAANCFSAGAYAIKLENIKVTDGTLTIKVAREGEAVFDWTVFDNFRLTYYGEEVPEVFEGTKFDISWAGQEIPADALKTYNFNGQWQGLEPSIRDFDPANDKQIVIKFAEPLTCSYNVPFKNAAGEQQWNACGADQTGWDIMEIDVKEVMTEFYIQNTQTTANSFTITDSYVVKNDESQVPLTWTPGGWGPSVSVSGITSGVATISSQWAGVNMTAPEAFLQDGTKTLRIYANADMKDLPFQWCLTDVDGQASYPAIGVDETGLYAEFTTDLKIKSLYLQHTSTEPHTIDIKAITWEFKAAAAELEMATVSIEKGEKSIVIKSSNAEYALQTKFKPVSELEEGETPESTVTSIIEEMAGAFATAQEFEDYFVSMATKGEKEIDLEGIEEVYPAGTEFFVAACNIAWDPIANKVALASNVAVDTYVIPAAPVVEPANLDELVGTVVSLKNTEGQYIYGKDAQNTGVGTLEESKAESNTVVAWKVEKAENGYLLRAVTPAGGDYALWGASVCYFNAQPNVGGVTFILGKDQDAENGSTWQFFYNEEKGGYAMQCVANNGYCNGATTSEEAQMWFTFEPYDATGIAAISSAAKDGKFLQNGKIVIVKNGKAYNTVGARIK